MNKNYMCLFNFKNVKAFLLIYSVNFFLVKTSLTYSSSLYNGSLQVVGVSQGMNHITISSHPVGQMYNCTLDMYNTNTKTSNVIYQTNQYIYSHNQILWMNTLQNNNYLISTKNSSSNLSLSRIGTSNLTVFTNTSWAPTTKFQIYHSNQVNLPLIIYQLVTNASIISLNRRYQNSYMFIQSMSIGQIPYQICYCNNLFYILYTQGCCNIYIIAFLFSKTNETDMCIGLLAINYNSTVTNLMLQCGVNYLAVGFGINVNLYYAKNYSNFCNITLNSTLYDLRISNTSIYATTHTSFYQYNITNCNLFDSAFMGAPYRISIVQASAVNPTEKLFLWRNDTNASIRMFTADMSMGCEGGCTSCIAGYMLNCSSMTCYYVGGNDVANVTCNTTENTTNATNITQTIYNQCYFEEQGTCFVYCSYQCNTCSSEDSIYVCATCNKHFIQVMPGVCQLPHLTTYLIGIATVFNNFKAISAQGFFFMIDDIEHYQYHENNYTGIIKIIFQQLNFFHNNQWSFLPFNMNDWVQRPYQTQPYIYFSNKKYVQVQHIDSLFYQSMKQTYTVKLVFTLLFYLIFRFLYRGLSKVSIKIGLKIYSFWAYYFNILLGSNVKQISFCAILHFQNAFNFSFNFKMLNVLSLLFIGLFFIFMMSFFILNKYFYGNNHKYFLVNTKKSKYPILYNFMKISIIPCVLPVVHLHLNQIGGTKLIVLGSILWFTILFDAFLQLKYSIFKSKAIFVLDTIALVCMLCVNFGLFFKHFIYVDEQIIINLLEQLMAVLCYLLTMMICLGIFWPFLEIIVNKIFKTTKKKDGQIQVSQPKKQQLKRKEKFPTQNLLIYQNKKQKQNIIHKNVTIVTKIKIQQFIKLSPLKNNSYNYNSKTNKKMKKFKNIIH